MATRMPWGAPTTSDVTKLRPVLTGTRLASAAWFELLPQIRITDNFVDLAGWTEVDSGGNVNVAGGIVSFQGNGVAFANGIYRTLATPRVLPAVIEFKLKMLLIGGGAEVTFYVQHIGQHVAMTTTSFRNGCFIDPFSTRFGNRIACNGPGDGQPAVPVALLALTNGDWLTFRLYMLTGGPGGFATAVHRRVLTLQDPHLFPVETVLVDITGSGSSYGDWYATNTRVQFSRATNHATLHEMKEFRYYDLYPTDGPLLTFVADAGAGKIIDTFDLTNLAPIGGWATTNATFAWSFDDGVAAYSAEHTLAAMNAHGVQAGRHRYARLRITVNSDGVTQQHAGEVNADDATLGIGDFPEVANVLPNDTTNGVTGTAKVRVSADIKIKAV